MEKCYSVEKSQWEMYSTVFTARIQNWNLKEAISAAALVALVAFVRLFSTVHFFSSYSTQFTFLHCAFFLIVFNSVYPRNPNCNFQQKKLLWRKVETRLNLCIQKKTLLFRNRIFRPDPLLIYWKQSTTSVGFNKTQIFVLRIILHGFPLQNVNNCARLRRSGYPI